MPDGSPFSENLRFLLWQSGIDRNGWIDHVSSWLGHAESFRAEKILAGATVSAAEMSSISKRTHVSDQDLLHSRMVDGIDVLRENIMFLFDSLEFGQKGDYIRKIGVSQSAVAKWQRGQHRPRPHQVLAIKKAFGLSIDADLERDAIFLSMKPVTIYQMQNWLIKRINDIDVETLRKYYPAIRKLLEDE